MKHLPLSHDQFFRESYTGGKSLKEEEEEKKKRKEKGIILGYNKSEKKKEVSYLCFLTIKEK